MENLKKCSTCKKEKPVSDFYKCKRSRDGLKCQCKKCHNITTVISRDIDKHRDYSKQWHRKSKYWTREEVRERDLKRSRVKNKSWEAKARSLANRAVDLGFLSRPDYCSECGGKGWGIHAHHEDYNKPLEVIWLCTDCHGKKHRKSTTGKPEKITENTERK